MSLKSGSPRGILYFCISFCSVDYTVLLFGNKVSMTSQNSKQSSLVNHSKPRWYQLVDSTSRSRARRKSIVDCYAAAERLSPGSDYPYGLPVEHMLVIPLYAGSSIVGALQIINRCDISFEDKVKVKPVFDAPLQ